MNCPNCKSDQTKEVREGRLYCPVCDIVYKVDEDGSRVDESDVIAKLNSRVEKLEADRAKPRRAVTQPAGPDLEPGPDDEIDDDDDDDILPR